MCLAGVRIGAAAGPGVAFLAQAADEHISRCAHLGGGWRWSASRAGGWKLVGFRGESREHDANTSAHIHAHTQPARTHALTHPHTDAHVSPRPCTHFLFLSSSPPHRSLTLSPFTLPQRTHSHAHLHTHAHTHTHTHTNHSNNQLNVSELDCRWLRRLSMIASAACAGGAPRTTDRAGALEAAAAQALTPAKLIKSASLPIDFSDSYIREAQAAVLHSDSLPPEFSGPFASQRLHVREGAKAAMQMSSVILRRDPLTCATTSARNFLHAWRARCLRHHAASSQAA